MEPNTIKHLEFIQSIITRMNTNSFQIKGWMITLVSALVGVYLTISNISFVYIAIFPVIVFWALDAFYLQQERKFRGLYNDVIEGKIPDFKMPINNYNANKNCKYSYCDVLFSKTILGLYFPILIALVIMICTIKTKN